MESKVNFTRFSKNEMLQSVIQENCCKRAWLAGAVKAIGSLQIEHGGKPSLVFETEDIDYLQTVINYAKDIYKTNVTIESAKGKAGKKGFGYIAKLPPEDSMYLLIDAGIIGEDGGLPTFIVGIKPEVISLKCCAKAFLKSIYIATGSANVPTKIIGDDGRLESNGGGYYLEFVLGDEVLAELIVKVLNYFDINSHTTERKGKYIVYLKDSEVISNTFALLEANGTVLYLQEILLERTLNNNLNRQSNCDAANADKIAIASAKQVMAIQLIAKTVGLNSLPDKLKELAEMRLQNPSAPMEFFTDALGDEVSKSGVNHRFRKLVSIADEIAEKQNTEN